MLNDLGGHSSSTVEKLHVMHSGLNGSGSTPPQAVLVPEMLVLFLRGCVQNGTTHIKDGHVHQQDSSLLMLFSQFFW